MYIFVSIDPVPVHGERRQRRQGRALRPRQLQPRERRQRLFRRIPGKLLNICWFKAKKQERGYLHILSQHVLLFTKKKYLIYRLLVFKRM